MFQPSAGKNNNNHLNLPHTSENSHFGCIRLANRFRFLNLISENQGQQIYFGFEIETKKQVLIVCHQVKIWLYQINMDQKKQNSPKNDSYFHQPLWIGYQSIQGIKYRFHVYYQRGCSIQNYFHQLSEIKPIHIHFLLKIFVKLIKIMQIQKINSNSINLKTIFIYPKPGNLQSVCIDLFTFQNIITHKKINKQNIFNIKNAKTTTNSSQNQKKVSFSEDPIMKNTKSLTLEQLVIKFYQILIKQTLTYSATCSLQNQQSFNVLFSFLKKIDKNNQYLLYSSTQFIERFLDIQSTLLRQKLIDKKYNSYLEIEIQATKISYNLMRKSQCHIQQMDKILKAQENQLLSEIYQEHGSINLEGFLSQQEMEEKKTNDTALSEILISHAQISTHVFKNNFVKHHKSQIFQKPLIDEIIKRHSSQADCANQIRCLENFGY